LTGVIQKSARAYSLQSGNGRENLERYDMTIPQFKTRRALRLPAVMAKTGMRRTQIFDAVQRGVFPAPFKVLRAAALTRLIMTCAVHFADAPFGPVIKLSSTTTTSLCF
jgi:Prophage CP4-57 regulatory protein (AlpA)